MKKTHQPPRVFVHWRRAVGTEHAHLFIYTHEEYWSQHSACGGINSRHTDEVLYYLPESDLRCQRCALAETRINRQLELKQKRPM